MRSGSKTKRSWPSCRKAGCAKATWLRPILRRALALGDVVHQLAMPSASYMARLLEYSDGLIGWATRDNPEDIGTLCAFISQRLH